MSKINRHPVRRTAVGVLAGALALSGVVAAGTPAFATPTFELDRLAGNDRYETSAAIAAAFGPATSVILASGESGRTPDALAANFLAGVRNAPVILTRRDTTPEPILAALRASGATRITVVGGPLAVSDLQIASLRAAGYTVDRVAGANRYETAARVAEAGEGATASNVGLVASGVSTIDALAGGPLAFKGRHPLFLVTRNGIPGATLAAMRATGVTSVYVLGGEAVVGARVVAQLAAAGITVTERLAGADRSETSVAIAFRLMATFGFTSSTFNLASGLNEGIDALGGAALSGKQNRVLLITNTATSAAPVVAFATTRANVLTAPGLIFGGTTVVSVALEARIENAAGNFQTLTVTPTTPATLTLADDAATATAGTDDRTYQATGLTSGTVYRVTLVNSSGITIDANGQARFVADPDANSSTGFSALTGADIADITTLNGTALANGANTATATATVNGTLTFTIDGDAPGSVTPVVYLNSTVGGTSTSGGTSTRLEIAATATGQIGAPVELFGLGGAATFTAGTTGTPAPTDTTPPAFVSARGNAGAQTLTVTYSESLDATSVSAADYTIRLTGGSSDLIPTAATASGNTVTLTFGGGPFTSGLSGRVDKVDGQDVFDLARNDQADTDSVAFTTP